jgi:hypothetical protein
MYSPPSRHEPRVWESTLPEKRRSFLSAVASSPRVQDVQLWGVFQYLVVASRSQWTWMLCRNVYPICCCWTCVWCRQGLFSLVFLDHRIFMSSSCVEPWTAPRGVAARIRLACVCFVETEGTRTLVEIVTARETMYYKVKTMTNGL